MDRQAPRSSATATRHAGAWGTCAGSCRAWSPAAAAAMIEGCCRETGSQEMQHRFSLFQPSACAGRRVHGAGAPLPPAGHQRHCGAGAVQVRETGMSRSSLPQFRVRCLLLPLVLLASTLLGQAVDRLHGALTHPSPRAPPQRAGHPAGRGVPPARAPRHRHPRQADHQARRPLGLHQRRPSQGASGDAC